MTQEIELPNNKGPVSTAQDGDLDYWGKRLSGDLEKNPNKRGAAQDKKILDAIRAEWKRRNASKREEQKQQAAIVKNTATMSLGKAIHDPQVMTQHLHELAEAYHVVTPATRVDMLPEGCGVAISYVSVNPDPKGSDVYSVGDRLGLGMDALKRIGAAAAVNWDTRQSGRLDSGSEPRYVHFRAVGHVRNFDGSLRTISGEVEIDMREGSPQVEEIREKAAARARSGKKNDGGESQIREIRKFILRHAESKAKNRAIADMGVKRAYTKEELQKPFAIARLMWTGQSEDPEMRRVFAEKTADAMIGGMTALYGGQAPTLPQRNEPAPEFRGHEPPPVERALAPHEPEEVDPPWLTAAGEESIDAPEAPTNTAAKGKDSTQQAAIGDGYDDRGANPDNY